MVAAVVLTVLIQTSYGGQDILSNNLSTSQDAVNTAADNAQGSLTTISFSVDGGDRNVTIHYSAPGAGQFILVEEEGSSAIVDTLDNGIDFETIPADNSVGVFSLLFFENKAESGSLENCVPYYYRLRACTNDLQTCLVSNVVTAIPHSSAGCP